MTRRTIIVALGIVGLGLVFGLGPYGKAQQNPGGTNSPDAASPPEGVAVLARGPIHEAFAAPAVRGPRPSPITPKEPPKPIEELPPDQRPPGDNVQWIPGYWAWDEDSTDFLWVSGTYRVVPPDRHWVPGYWSQASGGWQWVAGFWDDHQKNDVDLLPAPPDPIEEAVPQQPAEPSIYQPGCWVFHEGRYLWRPGFWTGYREGWVWTPSYYVWTPGGFVFVDGYWDYALHGRGLLFAPVSIAADVRLRAGWSFRPGYVIADAFVLASLFERPSVSHYYFGDYFDARYGSLGFVAWTDARFGRAIPDPLFTYYRWQHRDNPNWEREMRQVYGTRRTDPAARPPRTLVQQGQMITRINAKSAVNGVNTVANLTAVVPLPKVNTTEIKLQPVTGAQHEELRKTAAQFRSFSTERAKVETHASVTPQPKVQPGELLKPHRVELPKSRPAPIAIPQGAKIAAPPARPVMPEPKPIHPGTGRPLDVPRPGKLPLDPVIPLPKLPGKPPPGPPTIPGHDEPRFEVR